MSPELTTATSAYPQVDLTNCDKEPIHLTRFVQPHGVLLVLSRAELAVLQASANAEAVFGQAADALVGQNLSQLLDEKQVGAIRERVDAVTSPLYLFTFAPQAGNPQAYDAILHRSGDLLVLELEALPLEGPNTTLPDFYSYYQSTHSRLQKVRSLEEYCRVAAEEVRRMTGFDRVMIYRFDEEWNGEVIGEDCAEGVESYLGLHYPASDIPRQARELYRRNWVRIVPNVDAEPVPIIPEINSQTGRPVDLSASLIRSLSPIHVQYLKNMGVQSSMSISIIKDNRLWGLIACHHMTPFHIPYRKRIACEFLGQQLSLQLSNRETQEDEEYRARMQNCHGDVIEKMRDSQFLSHLLLQNCRELEDCVNADGVAVCFDGNYLLSGKTPTEAQVQDLTQWLSDYQGSEDIFCTDHLSALYPEAAAYKEQASGIMAVAVSTVRRNFIIWFREERLKTVRWAGNPNKPVEVAEDGTMKIMPRTSFELWKENVQGRSLPWNGVEKEMMAGFRTSLLNLFLERSAEDLKKSNKNLLDSNLELESFAYIISHDLNSLVRKVHFYGERLENDARDAGNFPQSSLESIERLKQVALKMYGFINDVLALSRVSHMNQTFERVDLSATVADVLVDIEHHILNENATVEVGKLPVLEGNPTQMHQLFQNLISNAVKYHRDDVPPVVKVSAVETRKNEVRIDIQDNGAGFGQDDVDRIFKIFERLPQTSKREGSGIGLAICKKIVTRHHGAIEVVSTPGQGSTFSVILPKKQQA